MSTPIPEILSALSNLEKFQRAKANSDARVHAFGWTSLIKSQWFGGESAQISPLDLLPYPDELSTGSGQVNRRTLRVLLDLIKRNLLPPHVIDAATDNEEVRLAVEDGGLWQVGQS